MNKIIAFVAISTLLLSCSDTTKSIDIDEIINSKDLSKVKASREIIHKEYERIVADLAKLDEAIATLDKTKKLALVKTITLKDTTFTHYIEIQGNIDTKENIIIYPEYSGIITQLNTKAGQKVSSGQILARIDDGGLSSQLAQAETQLTLAKTTFERQKNLWEQKIGSEIQFLQAKTTMESQQKVISQIKSQMAKTLIKAPFSGTIDEVMVEKGKVVAPGQPLFRIVSLNNMYVTADVPEIYIGKLKIGAFVDIYLNALGKNYKGKVRQIGNYINPNNRTFSIEISVPNPDNLLRPNQVAVLKIEDYVNKNAIVLPTGIIQEKADGSLTVYTVEGVDNNNTAIATLRTVEIGYSSEAFVEVKSGINAGDIIITEGAKSIKEGAKVEIIK
jgi:membrane fusion protein, multidrug efflux system